MDVYQGLQPCESTINLNINSKNKLMTRDDLFKLVLETSHELEQAEYDLYNTPNVSATIADCEDLTDKHQEALEYRWWREEQIELIESLKAELQGYKDQLSDLDDQEDAARDEFYSREESYGDFYERTNYTLRGEDDPSLID
jgi:hypothetical protein